MRIPRKPDPEIHCKACGKLLVRRRFSNGRLMDMTAFVKQVYCDRECMKQGMNKDVCSSVSHSRRKSNSTMKEACEECGDAGKRHVHHLDGNPSNNQSGNLRTLCVSCHRLYHSPNCTGTSAQRQPCMYCNAPSVKNQLCHTHISRRWRFGHPLAKKKKIGSEWVLMYELAGKWYSDPSNIKPLRG